MGCEEGAAERPEGDERSERALPDNDNEAMFHEWVAGEIRACTAYGQYPEIMEQAIAAICGWRNRFRNDRDLWARIMRRDRVIKELNECMPVISHTVEMVSRLQLDEGGDKAVVLDLCSGYGYMSMLLSELLPPERVQKIVLLDRMWPLLNQDAPGDGQMSWNHIRHKGWPIPLETSKRDLKKGRAFKDLSTYLFNAAGLRRPFILIGVHLCSTLSIRAVELFNSQPLAVSLALKPCCLPQMAFLMEKPPRTWQLGNRTIRAKEVCADGSWNKGHTWIGESRGKLAARFNCWADHLCGGILPEEGCDCKSRLEVIKVQETHFQNAFVFAERSSVDQPWEGTAQVEQEPGAVPA